jgi:hypothetical protein
MKREERLSGRFGGEKNLFPFAKIKRDNTYVGT